MALSQMMQQYLNIKEKYKDCIIFFRLGDFYEMFYDDAIKGSKILGLTLTGRDCGMKERAPMCGVPYHAVNAYIAKLVENGEKVAICEQLESSQESKGMVNRGVVRVVTAGTVISDDVLDAKANNYIACVYKTKDCTALAYADITTGELFASEYFGEDNTKKCIAKMVVLQVKEVICNDEMLLESKSIPEITRGILPRFSNYLAWTFGYSAAERRLLEQFNSKTLAAYSVADKKNAICAAGALLEYLKETQMRALKNIDNIKYIANEKYMQLDSIAVKNLEILRTLGDNGKYGSLLWLLDKTSTSMGARYLSSQILYPLLGKDEINYRLDAVSELFDATVIRAGIKDDLKVISDIERISGKISNDIVLPKDLRLLGSSLSQLPNLRFKLSGFTSKMLNDIVGELCDVSEAEKAIDSSIAPEPPNNMRDGGYIKKGFNAELDRLRDIRSNGKSLIEAMESAERDKTGIRTLRIGYNRVFGYYIEVSNSFKDKVPLEYQRRQTLSNGERYITTELKKLEEEILSSEELSLKIEENIFSELKSYLLNYIERFKIISKAIAKLDMIISFAEIAKTNKYVRPKIVDANEQLKIVEGRHPVVEIISKERFVANDALLDQNENRTMIITGPNMAGKSTYMRQTAIIAIMAHLGSFVPAKSAEIPLIDRVFTRVGASDNLISDQSTFMVEMIEVATILQNATQNSLLILDEVGRGTSTYDGLSIAWAVIEHLTNHIKAKTLFATHYHELTELESKMEGVKNYKIAAKEINGNIVFLRKIMRGGANRSFGIEVASLAGVPASVTGRAKQILKMVESGEADFIDRTLENDEDVVVQESEVERILKEVDINSLSPMQAFMLVGDLVEKVKNEKN